MNLYTFVYTTTDEEGNRLPGLRISTAIYPSFEAAEKAIQQSTDPKMIAKIVELIEV